MRAIVVGAGFGGIASALRLRAKGYEVKLIDRCQMLGGRGQIFEHGGFRHDAGPTVITAPFLLEELFELFDERLQDYLTLVPLNPWYRFEYSDGDYFNYGGSLEETLAEIKRIEPQDCEGYLALLEHSRKIFEVGFTKLSAQPFDRFKTMFYQIPSLIMLRNYETVWGMVKRHLKSDKLRQAFSIQPLLVGGNPFNTTSIYGLIHFLERAHGVHFAMGGTGALVAALGQLMERKGIEIQLNTTVKSIVIDNKCATGVTLENGQIEYADVIVSNADAPYLYRSMVQNSDHAISTKIKLSLANYSMGLFVLYFGTNRTYPDVKHHTICIGPRYYELLKDIFDRKILADDFSLYLHRPTATDTSFAPDGCDSFYVLCPVPNLQASIDWSIQGPRLQDRIVSALNDTLLPGLKETIRSSFFKTPMDFSKDYLSVFGAGFSFTPVFRQSAWFRFHNKAEGIKNLYLAGAGTHPGAGLPGVLCSAKVLDALIPNISSRDALSKADKALASKGLSFHWARTFLSCRHASRATRLYGFCRMLDDLADVASNVSDPGKELSEVRLNLKQGYAKDDVIQDGISLFKECSIDFKVPNAMLEGLLLDTKQVRIQTEDELLRYAYMVAGTVGLLMSGVLDVTKSEARSHSIDLGIAMQLTNICRDIKEDARLGRIYIPSLGQKYEPELLIVPNESTQEQIRSASKYILTLADKYYASGEAGLSFLPLRARFGILIAARTYKAIGSRIKERNYAVWESKIYVSKFMKLWIAVKTFIELPFNSTFWWPKNHKAILHIALKGLPYVNTLN